MRSERLSEALHSEAGKEGSFLLYNKPLLNLMVQNNILLPTSLQFGTFLAGTAHLFSTLLPWSSSEVGGWNFEASLINMVVAAAANIDDWWSRLTVSWACGQNIYSGLSMWLVTGFPGQGSQKGQQKQCSPLWPWKSHSITTTTWMQSEGGTETLLLMEESLCPLKEEYGGGWDMMMGPSLENTVLHWGHEI